MVPKKLTFSPLSRRQIEADFSGGHITSDAGLLLLREVDNQQQLTQRLATVLDDARNPVLVRHTTLNELTRLRQQPIPNVNLLNKKSICLRYC